MLSIIVAVGRNNAIGKDNQLLWKLSNDLKRFKEITTGHTIIMGRKTFQSLPRILPNRQHIVLTKDKSININHEQVTVFYSIDKLLGVLDAQKEQFVIGGGEIYKALMPFCTRIYLTSVDKEFEADTFFPTLDFNEWRVISEEEGLIDEKNNLPHKFIVLERKL